MAVSLEEKITIEKGIPLKSNKGALGSLTKIFSEMKIGDSFVAPRQMERSNTYGYARLAKNKIATRDQEDGRIRVWRIK
jgi:hypothetical protein